MILAVNTSQIKLVKVLPWGTFLFLAIMTSCGSKDQKKHWITLEGNTQGTTFQINYYDSLDRDFSSSVDSIYQLVDSNFSTYVKSSIISTFNNNQRDTIFIDSLPLWKELWTKTRFIHAKSEMYFDPYIKPLVNFWGFGEHSFAKQGDVSINTIDSILEFKNQFITTSKHITKRDPRCMIDLNAIAQGYTVDLVCNLLDQKGISRYMVEIGGELRCKGSNTKNEFWKAGIDKPTDTSSNRALQTIVSLDNKALATSGSYRKYYLKDGKKYAHVIDPFTGYPTTHNLLSVSVIASTCSDADAYATALLCMGTEKAIKWLSTQSLEALLIYEENGQLKTYQTSDIWYTNSNSK